MVEVILFLAGLATGWGVFEDKVTHQHLSCPKVGKVEKIKKLVVEDCMEGCPKEYDVKITRGTRGEIDRFASDCREFEKATHKIIDGYNTKIVEHGKELEKVNKDK